MAGPSNRASVACPSPTSSRGGGAVPGSRARGSWGSSWLIPWLEHFGTENGLGVKDVERLRELAGPRWGRPVTDVPLSAHIPTIG